MVMWLLSGVTRVQWMIVTIHMYLVFKFGTRVCLVPCASLESFESWDVYINTLIEDVSRGETRAIFSSLYRLKKTNINLIGNVISP